uniref:Uncharacterized protein n=1 Tax=Meloidogyne incognita TaxID=6306 RepID=A0A914NAK4_MELIC
MDRPFLRLAPIKVEIIRFEPLAVIFRNIIADEEIEIIKNKALPKLLRFAILDSITQKPMFTKSRTSSFAKINIKTHPVVKQIAERMKLITNLNMKSAKPLDMVNYGVGGHCNDHFDLVKVYF